MTSTKDAFDQLQSQYAADGGVRSVFSSKVADYVESRPTPRDANAFAFFGPMDKLR